MLVHTFFSMETKAIFAMTIAHRACPTHLPDPITNHQVFSYFTTLTSPILAPGTHQSTFLCAAEILNRKKYHYMSSTLPI